MKVLPLLTALILLAAGDVAHAAGPVVISEFRTQGATNGDFVELLNVSKAPVSLTDYTVSNERFDASTQCTIAHKEPGPTLQPGQHFLIAEAGWTGTGDAAADRTMNGFSGACKELYDASGSITFTDGGADADTVGYGPVPQNGSPFEGSPFTPVSDSPTQSNNRKSNGRQDTDDNLDDFAIGTAEPEGSSVIDPQDGGDVVADPTPSPTVTVSPQPTPTASPSVPVVVGLAVAPRRFKAAKHGASLVTKGGAVVALSVPATEAVTFTVLRKHRARMAAVPGRFIQTFEPGAGTLQFSGCMQGKRLRKGRYLLVATPMLLNGVKGAPAVASFRVR